MTYSIVDAGNLVASFECEGEADAELERLVAASADAPDGLLVVAFDGAGNTVVDCVPGERIVSGS